MTLDEIKAATEAGQIVHWGNDGYTVVKDNLGQWLISHWQGHSIGLTWRDGVTLNGKPEEFYIAPTWTQDDHDAANREGWDLFDSDGSENGPLQLCKIDDPELWAADRSVVIERTWQEDNEAWVFVWSNPSDLHTKALAMIKAENPTEYAAIEKWVTSRG